MAGVKGRSGRRPRAYEISIDKIVNASNHVVYSFITDENQDVAKRAEVAARFSIKHMPEKVELNDKNALTREEKLALVQSVGNLIANRRRTAIPSG